MSEAVALVGNRLKGRDYVTNAVYDLANYYR